MKRIILALLIIFLTVSVNAQPSEPQNNIGKSLLQMKQSFPELRYIESDLKGDKYEDGYPQAGIAVFFYFKEDKVVEECMIVQSSDGFSHAWYEQMVDSFSKYSYGFGTNSPYAKHWVYSTFTIHIIYVQENGSNTAMVFYEKGGFNTGVTGTEFFKKYK